MREKVHVTVFSIWKSLWVLQKAHIKIMACAICTYLFFLIHTLSLPSIERGHKVFKKFYILPVKAINCENCQLSTGRNLSMRFWCLVDGTKKSIFQMSFQTQSLKYCILKYRRWTYIQNKWACYVSSILSYSFVLPM